MNLSFRHTNNGDTHTHPTVIVRKGFYKFVRMQKSRKWGEDAVRMMMMMTTTTTTLPPNDNVMGNKAIPIVLLPWHSILIIFIATFAHCPTFFLLLRDFSFFCLRHSNGWYCCVAFKYPSHYDHWTENQFLSSIAGLFGYTLHMHRIRRVSSFLFAFVSYPPARLLVHECKS